MTTTRKPKITLLCGDVLKRLQTLADNSVHCVVTSPPYWGLRDYGTGKWRGGSKTCAHKKQRLNPHLEGSTLGGGQKNNGHQVEGFKFKCPRCGAIRVDDQIGLERTPEEYIAKMVAVFAEVRRVLRDDGTLWLNLGDSYASDSGKGGRCEGYARAMRAGSGRADGIVDKRGQRNRDGVPRTHGLKAKDLVGIPWMLAFALRADGWYLRQDIIWSKPNPIPEPVTDRCTKSHEHIFLLTKSKRYFFDHWAIQEPSVCVGKRGPGNYAASKEAHGTGSSHTGLVEFRNKDEHITRNKRNVWTVATQPYKEDHFATFPEALITPCVLAGTSSYGCCPQCGEPYRRVMRRSERTYHAQQAGCVDRRYLQGRPTHAEHIGWEMSCYCAALPPAPCSVVDPFCGSGTVGVVCKRFALNFTGIDLNRKYLEMAKRRIAGAK